MSEKDFLDILNKISNGSASEEDIALYLEWYKRYEPVDKLWENMQATPEAFSAELLFRIRNKIGISAPAKPVVRLWPRMLAAASVIILLSVGGYFTFHKSRPSQHAILARNIIVPGGNKAILTLSNGKQIALNGAQNGTLAVQGNIAIDKTQDGQIVYKDSQANASDNRGQSAFNTVTTPRGGQYQVVLPDGSKVLLNAASSLKYPIAFAGDERRVELTGEAYFEVAKNPDKPFLVNVNGVQEIKVLGTHFDIKSYTDDQDISTTLLEGSVQLTYKSQKVILKPGQIAVNDMAQPLIIKNADIDEVMAWKNGLFVFNDVEIKDLLKIAARWYDIDVEYRGNITQKKLWGTVSMHKSINELLDNIAIISGIHYQIEGRRVILSN